jgi:uncharacterized protein HemX
MALQSSTAKEISLGEDFGDVAVKVHGVCVEVHRDGSTHTYTDAKACPVVNDDGKAARLKSLSAQADALRDATDALLKKAGVPSSAPNGDASAAPKSLSAQLDALVDEQKSLIAQFDAFADKVGEVSAQFVPPSADDDGKAAKLKSLSTQVDALRDVTDALLKKAGVPSSAPNDHASAAPKSLSAQLEVLVDEQKSLIAQVDAFADKVGEVSAQARVDEMNARSKAANFVPSSRRQSSAPWH